MRRHLVSLLLAKSSAVLIFLSICGSAALAQSPSHAYINSMRSSYETHYFVSIGVNGQYGLLKSTDKESGLDDETTVLLRSTRWQGYGVRNELGIEFLKFLHFSVAHTSLNLRSKNSSTENMSGSRLEGAGSLNFYAPLGNLQLGGGLIGSRMDLRKESLSADFYGSGYFYNGGYNYFLSNTVSFYMDMRRSIERLVRNSGEAALPGNIQSELTEVGLGFKIWL